MSHNSVHVLCFAGIRQYVIDGGPDLFRIRSAPRVAVPFEGAKTAIPPGSMNMKAEGASPGEFFYIRFISSVLPHAAL